jgi:hypothetical protein
MSAEILNIIRREVAAALAGHGKSRRGRVVSYDQTHYAAKVFILPDGPETAWMPVSSDWVGNGWGIFAPPSEGDIVEVAFQEGGLAAPHIVNRFYSAVTKPLPVPSGEFWLVHKTGSFLKFHNDGSVEVNVATNLTATVGGNLSATITGTTDVASHGNLTVQTDAVLTLNATGLLQALSSDGIILQAPSIAIVGNLSQSSGGSGPTSANFEGTIHATQNISSDTDVLADGTSGHGHTHRNTQPGSGSSGAPN